MSDVISVLTSKSVETIVFDRGSQSWALDRNRASRCDYLVVCRNAHNKPEGPEEHGSAFLVGKISDVVASTETEGRFKILITEFAHVDWEDQWGERRNPVAYYKDSDYKNAKGVPYDFKRLEYLKIDDYAPERAIDMASLKLTIAEAKAGLAAGLNLLESAIEITIRA